MAKMKTVVYVLCLICSMSPFVLDAPAVSAQGVGWGTEERVDRGIAGDVNEPKVAVDSNGNAIAVWDAYDGWSYHIVANRYVAGSGWGDPEVIDAGDNPEFPQVAVDPSGNALAVWDDWDGTRYSIFANRYVVGAGWGTAELVEMDNTGDAYEPQVSVDSNGNAMAVWYQHDGARDSIFANRYVVGTGWGTAGLVETNDTGSAYGPQVAVDPAGNAVAVWCIWDGAKESVFANRYVVGASWGAAELIEKNDVGSAYTPQVAVDPAGNAIAVWHQWDGVRDSVYANRYAVGTGWENAQLIETNNTGDAQQPQIAVDPNGNATAVWFQWDGANDNLWANRYVVGTGWGTPELIETNDTGSARWPEVAVDPSGNAVAVWRHWNGFVENIWANRYVVGAGWAAPVLLETDDSGSAWLPQVAVDPSGNAVAVWYQSDGWRNHGWSNRYLVGPGWGTAELIEVDNDGADYPQVAVDPAGNAIAVWLQYDGSTEVVLANRYVRGVGWTSPVALHTNNTGDAHDPQVSVDPSGNAVAVWSQYDGARDSIYASRYVVGTGWGIAELIETNDTAGTGMPQVTMDAAGNAVAVWQTFFDSPYNIWANRYTVGTGWGTPELLETNDTGNAWYPQVAASPGGDAMAMWHQDDGVRTNIWANRYVAGTGWGTAELVESIDMGAERPLVGMDSLGNAIAVWKQYDGVQNSIYANRYVVGTGWGTPGPIETDDVSAAEEPQVAVDSSGNAIATWMSLLNFEWRIVSNRYAAGTGWETPQVIDTAGNSYYPQVAVDPRGNAVAVWHQGSSGQYDIYSNEYVVGTGWGTAELVEADAGISARDPQVGVDASGNAVAVWVLEEPVRTHVWANWYDAPDLVPPIADAGPDQTVTAGTLATLDGSGSTDNIGIITYKWTFDDGGLRELLGVSPTYSFYNTGIYTVTLFVSDAAGYNDTDTVVITVNPAPDTERPLADAGTDQSVAAGTLVTFDGSGSTDNVGIVNYTWRFDDGGTRTLYGVSPTYTFNNVGVFVVTLGVRDAAGNPDADTVIITVTPPPDTQNPVADAGPDRTILAGDTIVLDGSGSTDNVGIVNYTWTFDDGGTKYFYTPMFPYQFGNVGVFTITLDVRDAAGNPGTDTVVITVDPAAGDTERPVANAGPDQSVAAGTLVTFDGSASTDNVGIANYTWIFNDGGARTRYGVSPTYRFNSAGVFVVTLTARDAAGNSDADEVVITVTPPSDTQNPVADAGPDRNVIAGDIVVLDGSGSTDNVGITNYTWTFNDGGAKSRYGVMFSYQFSNVGAITITLTVRDAAGNSDTDTAAVTVNPVTGDAERPIADAGPDQAVNTGTLVTFDGSGSTDNVGVTNYTWTFIDGVARTLWAAAPTYTFSNAGTFVVTLTVRDAAGNTDQDVMVVTATVPSTDTQDPVADAGPDQSIVAGSTTVLDGSRSTDDVGVVNYTWTFTYGGSSRTLYGQKASFKFDTVGSYTVTLTVRDAAGKSGTDDVVVAVTAVPSGGTTEKEVTPAWAIAAIVILAVLAAMFVMMLLLSKRKKGGETVGGGEPKEGGTQPEQTTDEEDEELEEEAGKS